MSAGSVELVLILVGMLLMGPRAPDASRQFLPLRKRRRSSLIGLWRGCPPYAGTLLERTHRHNNTAAFSHRAGMTAPNRTSQWNDSEGPAAACQACEAAAYAKDLT